MKYNILRLMSNYNDFPPCDLQDQKPIMRVEQDLRSIQRNLNTLIKDTQSIKSDIAEIKQYIKEKEKEKEKVDNELTKGWFYF